MLLIGSHLDKKETRLKDRQKFIGYCTVKRLNRELINEYLSDNASTVRVKESFSIV